MINVSRTGNLSSYICQQRFIKTIFFFSKGKIIHRTNAGWIDGVNGFSISKLIFSPSVDLTKSTHFYVCNSINGKKSDILLYINLDFADFSIEEIGDSKIKMTGTFDTGRSEIILFQRN